jgi:hypothetical protein
MDFTVERNELDYTVSVEWNSESVIGDNGLTYWEVTGWWVTHVDGEKVDRAEADEWAKLLDPQEVENEISEWEAGQ